MKTTHLLYLHGFRSSPQSAKARLMAERVRRDHPATVWCCPQLPPSPAAALELILALTADWPRETMAVLGSSLGGCYAARLAVETGCATVVLLNPAVQPARDLAQYIGEQSSWQDPAERFYFRPDYVEQLRAIEAGALPHPEQCLAIIAQGDELLDWREMVARHPGVQLRLVEGGDHGLSDFERAHLDAVIDFLQLA
ncbi:MAG: esterase [Burkholderiales bacterium]|nr:esterase [Burkholderiales bacterium]